ncbi:hypothetical protein DFH09DRAFT_1412748 [Mycena vulgaris]|nr:hypothetical protein DFH09DRAFT_1412748 [Mycena vulgaris]
MPSSYIEPDVTSFARRTTAQIDAPAVRRIALILSVLPEPRILSSDTRRDAARHCSQAAPTTPLLLQHLRSRPPRARPRSRCCALRSRHGAGRAFRAHPLRHSSSLALAASPSLTPTRMSPSADVSAPLSSARGERTAAISNAGVPRDPQRALSLCRAPTHVAQRLGCPRPNQLSSTEIDIRCRRPVTAAISGLRCPLHVARGVIRASPVHPPRMSDGDQPVLCASRCVSMRRHAVLVCLASPSHPAHARYAARTCLSMYSVSIAIASSVSIA